MWPPRRSTTHELELQKEVTTLQLKLLRTNAELRTKQIYAQRGVLAAAALGEDRRAYELLAAMIAAPVQTAEITSSQSQAPTAEIPPLMDREVLPMPKHQPTNEEHQQVLDENDALRIENVQLRRELNTEDQTIDQLQLKERAKSMHMGDLHEQIYQLGVANRDLETEVRNLKLDKEHLQERLADKQQYIIDGFQLTGPGDVLGGAPSKRATRRM